MPQTATGTVQPDAGMVASTRDISSSAWTIETIDGEEALSRLGREWTELLEQSSSDCLFLTREWLHTWSKHLCDGRLSVLALRKGRSLAGIAPFFVRRGLSRRGELMGSGTIGSDYLDLIVAREHRREVLDELAEHLHRNPRPLRFRRVRAAGSLVSELLPRLQERGWRHTGEVTNVCPYIELRDHSWKSYLMTLSSSHRYNFRRRRRQLEKRFDVEFEIVDTETRRQEGLDALIQLHLARWSERGGSEAFQDQSVIDFHHEFTRRALRRGWLRLGLLKLDGRVAAAIYGLRYNDRFLFYQSGFDTEFARYSVGMVAMGLSIRAAMEEGVQEYDLLHGDESYKSSWAKASRGLSCFEAYPPSASGFLLMQQRRAVKELKSAARSWLPEPLIAALAKVRS